MGSVVDFLDIAKRGNVIRKSLDRGLVFQKDNLQSFGFDQDEGFKLMKFNMWNEIFAKP